MPSDPEKLLCYNRGCNQQFSDGENHEKACRYHPGKPVFHDAYKGWDCCDKKSTDFGAFLNIPGCSYSFHSNQKPAEPAKPKEQDEKEIIEVKAPAPPIRLQRPTGDLPMIDLPVKISDSLKQALETTMKKLSVTETEEGGPIRKGTSCKNRKCEKVYVDESSNEEECRYHPGVPIFHEGAKFWSCCNKKTTEFEQFLKQEGCTIGKHMWINDKEGSKKTTSCRFDWHQTGKHVVVSIYAKRCNPEKAIIRASSVKCYVYIEFEDEKVFELDTALYGIVDEKQSRATLMGTKVEIQFLKAEPISWKTLQSE